MSRHIYLTRSKFAIDAVLLACLKNDWFNHLQLHSFIHISAWCLRHFNMWCKIWDCSSKIPWPEKNNYHPLLSKRAVLPVVLFLTADLEAVVKWESLVSVPVRQLDAEGVLPLAGQLVDVLVPQPVLRRHAPKALKRRNENSVISAEIALIILFFFVNHRQRDCSWLCPLFSENDKILTPEDLWNGREVIFLIYSLMYFCQSEERSEHTVP